MIDQEDKIVSFSSLVKFDFEGKKCDISNIKEVVINFKEVLTFQKKNGETKHTHNKSVTFHIIHFFVEHFIFSPFEYKVTKILLHRSGQVFFLRFILF